MACMRLSNVDVSCSDSQTGDRQALETANGVEITPLPFFAVTKAVECMMCYSY